MAWVHGFSRRPAGKVWRWHRFWLIRVEAIPCRPAVRKARISRAWSSRVCSRSAFDFSRSLFIVLASADVRYLPVCISPRVYINPPPSLPLLAPLLVYRVAVLGPARYRLCSSAGSFELPDFIQSAGLSVAVVAVALSVKPDDFTFIAYYIFKYLGFFQQEYFSGYSD